MPYDPSTDVGKVRLLISDTADPPNEVFGDNEIQVFLSMHGDVVLLSAAKALEVIANNEVLVQKRIKTLDLQTDGPAEAKALLDISERWRKEYAEALEADDNDLGFEIVEFAGDQFSRREKLLNEWLRNGGP